MVQPLLIQSNPVNIQDDSILEFDFYSTSIDPSENENIHIPSFIKEFDKYSTSKYLEIRVSIYLGTFFEDDFQSFINYESFSARISRSFIYFYISYVNESYYGYTFSTIITWRSELNYYNITSYADTNNLYFEIENNETHTVDYGIQFLLKQEYQDPYEPKTTLPLWAYFFIGLGGIGFGTFSYYIFKTKKEKKTNKVN